MKKINNSEQITNVSIGETKPRLTNGRGKITKIQTDSSISQKEISLKLENFEEPVNINIKLKSTKELNKIKEIEDIQKLNANKINLTLFTVFDSDSELGAFIQSLEKVISKVRNLKWIIEGKLKDNSSGQFIGQVLKKCLGLYSLHLELVFPFLDSSASELASSLPKLKDLKILKLWIIDPYLFSRTYNHYFTHMGNCKIIDSIKQLKHLQIYEYNNHRGYYNLRLLDYYNITFVVKTEYDHEWGINGNKFGENKKYLEEQLQRGQYKTTSLNITDNYFQLTFKSINQGFDPCDKMKEERIEHIQQFYEILLGMIDLVFALPYLTSFRVSYFGLNSSNQFPEIYPDEKLTKKELITKQLIQERFLTVSSYHILVKYAYTEIPLNPHLLFSDLYFN